ncbi:MAG: 3-phosphoshikimate 1-carboxyvinyltransferase [Gammaproteobacteria bacterium]
MQQAAPTPTHPIQATINIPGSKSITNRALILAALAQGSSRLSNMQISDDTLTLITALKQLGIEITVDKKNTICYIKGCDGVFPNNKATIWCQDAGTIARFLLAACAIMPGEYYIDATPRLRTRPITPLLNALIEQGATILPAKTQSLPLTLRGKRFLAGGHITIDASLSSQIASALLMIAPFTEKPVTLTLKQLVSEPYIAMTLSVMAAFGVTAKQIDALHFHIPNTQHYQATEYAIEPDYSTASYFFAAAAVTGGHITIQPTERAKVIQGDIAFLGALEQMGCRVEETASGLSVHGPKELTGIKIDMGNFSDTFMTLAAIAPFAKGPTHIYNIAHARLKESDRIAAMESELSKLGVRVESGKDWMTIYPSETHGGLVDPHNDHRIAMACAVVGLRTPGVMIDNAECVGKTCPEFFELWNKM